MYLTLVLTGDIDSLRRDLEDPARPMKSSAFASEEPAPFTPVSLKGFSLVILVIFPKPTLLDFCRHRGSLFGRNECRNQLKFEANLTREKLRIASAVQCSEV